ncbi:hypothetical protein GCK32_019709, partial [Trichostrongylus colubriformis]
SRSLKGRISSPTSTRIGSTDAGTEGTTEAVTGTTEDADKQPLLPKAAETEKTLTWIDIEATVPMVGKSAKARRKTVLRGGYRSFMFFIQ